MSETFVADPEIERIAIARADSAIRLAAGPFGVALDWSDRSIEQVERILAGVHADLATRAVDEAKIYALAETLGSYVGEVYRRNHGATWGNVTLGSETYPGLRTDNDVLFWPWGRVYNRLVNGAEDNLAWYYHLLLEKTNGPLAQPSDPQPSDRQPWWKRLFRP